MLIVAAAVAGASLATFDPPYDSPRLYLGQESWGPRPIATAPLYPAAMTDDVHRPGFNGRMWVTRPVIGGMRGPWAVAEGAPGASAYGAFTDQDATVYARINHTVIGINAWEAISKPGLAHLERARQFWLREHNYTGGVRTFVNDKAIWGYPPAERPVREASAGPAEGPKAGPITPRATITIPADVPRAKHRIRVQSAPAAPARATTAASARVMTVAGARVVTAAPGRATPARAAAPATIAALPGAGPARISVPSLAGSRPAALPSAPRAAAPKRTVIVRAG